MPLLSLANFVDGIFGSDLLDAAQRAELRRLKETAKDTRELAQELMRRDWLTAYQINQILQGNGEGLTLGPYVLLKRIGEGGMGQVYQARQKMLQRVVALKVIRKECLNNPKVVLRFQREIRAAGQLNHPHIVRAFDADQVNGTWYFAMEFIDGVDLAQLIKEKGPLPIAQACEYIRQAALGLQHAFERGLVHRDIKPANLLVTKAVSSDRRRSSGLIARPTIPDIKRSASSLPRVEVFYPWGIVKILDMGLARCTDPLTERSATHLTQVGSVMGTPEYIAPEQARDSHTSDTRADLYSLGCTLYYLLAGQPPFPQGTVTEKLLQHQFDEPRPVASARRDRLQALSEKQTGINVDNIDPRVPTAVVKVLKRLMAKRPEDRHQTPIELANDLQDILKKLADGSLPMDEALDESTDVLPVLKDAAVGGSTTEIQPAAAAKKAAPRWQHWHIVPLILASLGGCAVLLIVSVLAVLLSRGRATQVGAAPPEPIVKTKVPTAPTEPAWKKQLRKSVQQRGSWEDARLELLKHRAALDAGPQTEPIDDLLRMLPTPLDALERASFEGILPPGQPPEVVALYGFAKGPFASKPVHSVAVSADGRWLITNEDANVRLFDLAGSMIPHKIPAHEKRVTRIVLSPDGRLLASAGEDGAVRVWDVHTRNRLTSFNKHQEPVTQVAFSPDGTQIVSAGRDGYVRIWDARTASETSHVKSGFTDVLALAFTPDGRDLFWTGYGKDIRWTRVKNSAEAGKIQANAAGSRFLAFQPQGDLLVLGGLQGQLLVGKWDGEKFVEKSLLKEQQQVSQVAFAPDGKTFVSVGVEPVIVVWDAQTLKPRKMFKSIRAAGASVAFSPEGRHLVIGGGNNQVFVIRLAEPDLNALARAVD